MASEQNPHAAQLNEAEMVFIMEVEAHRHPTEVLRPREQSLDIASALQIIRHNISYQCEAIRAHGLRV